MSEDLTPAVVSAASAFASHRIDESAVLLDAVG
jgi:hypothetical protein